MSMIDVNTIGFDDLLELIDERLTSGFNTQNSVNLNHIVTISLVGVDLEVGQATT